MHKSYQTPEYTKIAVALAGDIVALMQKSGVTYQECLDSLELAEKMLFTTTRPVKAEEMPKRDS